MWVKAGRCTSMLEWTLILSAVSRHRSIQLLSNPSLSRRTAAGGFVPLWIMNAPGICARPFMDFLYWCWFDMTRPADDLMSACRPLRLEVARSGHPDLSQRSLQGSADNTMYVWMQSNTILLHYTLIGPDMPRRSCSHTITTPIANHPILYATHVGSCPVI